MTSPTLEERRAKRDCLWNAYLDADDAADAVDAAYAAAVAAAYEAYDVAFAAARRSSK